MRSDKRIIFNSLIFIVFIMFFLFKGTYSNDVITSHPEFNYIFDVENKIIRNIIVGTTVSEFLEGVKVNDAVSLNVKLTSSDGSEKVNDDVIKTGDLLIIYDKGSKIDEYFISVLGDSDGNGKVNTVDLIQLRKHMVKYQNIDTGVIEVKTGVYKDAIDISGDGIVNSLDLIMARKIIVGLIEPVVIEFVDDKINLAVGVSHNIEYRVLPSIGNNKLKWESSNPDIAVVDQNGKVTAVASGTTTITVTPEYGFKKVTCEVVVDKLSLNISQTSVTLIDESTTKLTASLSANSIDDKSVTWKSSNENIATVNKNGVVTAKSSGTATITAVSNYDNSLTAKCTVKVRAAKYLFVGNSKTYYPGKVDEDNGVPKRFKSISKNAGYEVEYTLAVIGSNTLGEILTKYKDRIKKNYDYVVLQESAAVIYSDRDTYYDSVNKIKEIVEAENQDVKVYLRKVWGVVKKDADGNPTDGWTQKKIQTTFDNADYIVKKLNIGVINDGPLFYDVIDNTNVKIAKYQGEDTTDIRHQNANGAYLTALCIYSEIYEKDPTVITYNAGISDSNVSVLKKYAKKHCYNN